MKYAIFSASLYISFIFFCVMAILGLTYEGVDESPIYIYVCLTLGAISIGLSYISIYKHRAFGKNLFFLLGIPLFLIIGGIVDSVFLGRDESMINHKQQLFFAFVYPSICVACCLACEQSLHKLAKWLDVVGLIITTGLALTVPKMLLGYGWTMGGASYQRMAYAGAQCFGINLCFFLFGDRMELFRFFKTRLFRYFRVVLMLIQVFCVLMSGGRGGAILMIVNALLLFYYVGSLTKVLFYGILAFALISIVGSQIAGTAIGDLLGGGVERAFAYIGNSGIDMKEGSSGRDIVYNKALELISERPILGYGMYGAYEPFGGSYPHNLFLEVLLQGGIIYLCVFLYILVRFFIKFKKILKQSPSNLVLLPIVTYPFIQLMFSDSYMTENAFFFAMVYVFSVSLRLQKSLNPK